MDGGDPVSARGPAAPPLTRPDKDQRCGPPDRYSRTYGLRLRASTRRNEPAGGHDFPPSLAGSFGKVKLLH